MVDSGQHIRKAARLVYIRDLISERPRTTRELANICDVDERTIRYDLTDLSLPPLSFPIYADALGRWAKLDSK